MHRVGIPRQSSGGYPAFGLKNPFRTRGDYQVYFQIGHGGQILQNGLASGIPLAPLIPRTRRCIGSFSP